MIDESVLESFRCAGKVGLISNSSSSVSSYCVSPLGQIVVEAIERELHQLRTPYGTFLAKRPDYEKKIKKIENWYIASGLDYKQAPQILRRIVAFIREKEGRPASFASIFGALEDFPVWLIQYFPAAKNAMLRQHLITKLYS
jgi:hypothetical protein